MHIADLFRPVTFNTSVNTACSVTVTGLTVYTYVSRAGELLTLFVKFDACNKACTTGLGS